MDFFSETSDTEGVIGLGITLRSRDLRLTDSFRELVSPFKSRCGEIEIAFDLAFLSKTKPPLGIYCICHGHIVEDKLQHFLIALGRKPKSEAPQEMVHTSERLGGYPTGLPKVWSALEEQEVKWRATLKVAIAKPKRWPLKFPAPGLQRSAAGFKLEEQELRFKNTKENVSAVFTFTPNMREYALEINATVEARFDATCFNEVGEQLWSKASALFGKK